jgi:hypothetical protein
VLQQLGWLHHQQSNSYTSQEKAIEYLEKSVSAGMWQFLREAAAIESRKGPVTDSILIELGIPF